ncbi:helix-turn-helix domain-containing protein [Ktedonobacter racemifer]|uniref:Transcriptional regulator, XRE family n=1 Tax=Ktedonobacter racemifer DSM 44963 TaxID=485913 RepID=D6TQ59_KTERA|nr:helix-turn-helix transcriptional regulator [Ktedonobacter racemifer]EFH85707.1 transcriptional regulator, XRE family [Ktedonobacter racemifer DSM 44963]
MYRLRIQEIAVSKGIKQIDLVRQANISLGTAHKLWNNPTTDVQLSTLERIAKLLQVPVTQLIEDIPDAADK